MSGPVGGRGQRAAVSVSGMSAVSLAGALADGAGLLAESMAEGRVSGLESVEEARDVLVSLDGVLAALPELFRLVGAHVGLASRSGSLGIRPAIEPGSPARSAWEWAGHVERSLLCSSSLLVDAQGWSHDAASLMVDLFDVAPDFDGAEEGLG